VSGRLWIAVFALAVLTTVGAAAAPRHMAGLGMGIGIRGSSHDVLAVAPEVGLPAFELVVFTEDEDSLDLCVPVGRIVTSAVLVERLWVGFDTYPTFRRSLGWNVLFLAAPGIGWMASAGGGNGTFGLRPTGRFGVEVRSPRGGFATAFLVQPGALFEFGDAVTAVSGGVMLWVRWTWLGPSP